MISFERTTVPAAFARRAGAEMVRARKFYDRPLEDRAHLRFEFRAVAESRSARDFLAGMTNVKCAFCEQPIDSREGDVFSHFRPPWGTTDAAGTVHADLYWWLATEWSNLFPICFECRRHRGTRFPLEDEAKRARGPGDEKHESPLLIDPAVEDPSKHFYFHEDGRIESLSPKGRATIDVWALNRPSLVAARATLSDELHDQLRRWQREAASSSMTDSRLRRLGTKVRDQLGNYLSAEFRYVAMARAIAAPWVAQLPANVRDAFFPRKRLDHWFEPLFDDVLMKKVAPKKVRSVAARARKVAPQEYVRRSQWISRILIEDFKGIEHLDLTIHEDRDSERWPWLMLLGENAAGKSTVLEAAALALGGTAYAKSLGLDAASFVRRLPEGSRKRRPLSGRVKVFIGAEHVIDFTCRRRSSSFASTADEIPLMVAAYGPIRMLPRGRGTPERSSGLPIRARNLFDPSVPLSAPASWLGNRKEVGVEEFGRIAHSLGTLFPDVREDWLRRVKGSLFAEVGTVQVPVLELSAGYQSVLAMSLDIYREFRRHFKAMEIAEGLVLIDEIGEHLHPRWKKRIVKDLRTMFPRVQFIATTHDPLCLRGVTGKEVALMRRTSRSEIYALTDLPAVEDMRVDQILASEFFGLDGVYDESMDRLLDEYHRLLALPRWTAAQAARLKTVKDEVHKREILGTTERERLLLDAIDKYLARDKDTASTRTRSRLHAELDREIGEALAQRE